MNDVIFIVLGGLVFFAGGCLAGVLYSLVSLLFAKLTKETPEEFRADGLKFVKRFHAILTIIVPLVLLFELTIGRVDGALQYFVGLLFIYFIFSVFDWGLATGVERRYVSPSRFLEILRKS